jgi:hypothetical protein
MSITMSDPVTRLLHLPPSLIGPPPAASEGERVMTDQRATS